ncbi:MAG TPA: pentapeptide repeat-containing protein [Ktedonobacterales bacterium]
MGDAQRYGDPLSPERQAELRAHLDNAATPVAEGETRKPLFAGVRLSGADVAWLAAPLRNEHGATPDLHLEGADLRLAHLEGADLRFAHLEGVELWRARLEGALLYGAHLEDASLFETHLEGAGLFKAHLEGARLLRAYLDGVDLVEARLEGARLNEARLLSADLTRAHLESKDFAPDDADLARIRAINPTFPAALPPADLRHALLDSATLLRGATLTAPGTRVGPRLSDLHWTDVALGALDWTPFTRDHALLGDERAARAWRPHPYVALEAPGETSPAKARRAFRRTQRAEGVAAWASGARANQRLAWALRRQGLGGEADYFAYRAQVMRRGALRRRRAWLRWLAAGWLGLTAGYGYRFGRALALYLAVIAVFSGVYLLAGAAAPQADVITVTQSLHAPLQWYDALALSAADFHGRGFFQVPLRPGDPATLLAVVESVIGLFIELGVVTAFARRYLIDR